MNEQEAKGRKYLLFRLLTSKIIVVKSITQYLLAGLCGEKERLYKILKGKS